MYEDALSLCRQQILRLLDQLQQCQMALEALPWAEGQPSNSLAK